MKNRVFACLALIFMIIMLFAGIATVFATTPTDSDIPSVTNAPVYDTTAYIPEYTDAPTDAPVITEVPTDFPEETEDMYEEETEAPTEYDEYNPPETNSPYEATQPMYNAPEYQGTAAVWADINEKDVISLKNDDVNGAMRFDALKDASEGDEHDYRLIIIGIVLIVISMAGVVLFIYTFVDKSKAPQHAGRPPQRRTPDGRPTQDRSTQGRSTEARRTQPSNGAHRNPGTRSTSASGARVPDPEARAARRRRDDFGDGY